MASPTSNLNTSSNEMNKHKNAFSKDGNDQGQDLEHHYDFDDLVGPTADESQTATTTATQAITTARDRGSRARGPHVSQRKSYSYTGSITTNNADLLEAKEEMEEGLWDLKQAVTEYVSRGVNFLRGLGVGWSLVLLDLFFGIPISLLLTYLNKAIISYLGYEKIMRCPSGILGSRIFFVVINAILVVHWGLQLNEEERVEGEIGYWGEVCAFLEGEREKIEERIAGEVESQLMVESFNSPSSQSTQDLRLGREGVREEEMIPAIPSTVQRRVIRPAVGTRSGSVVPKTGSSLRKEVTAGVIDPESLRDVKETKTKPNKMTVGRKAGLRIREEQGRRADVEDGDGNGDGESD